MAIIDWVIVFLFLATLLAIGYAFSRKNRNIEDYFVAGRCSSMNHEAMAATRVMSTCMALGEAAGTAARLALATGCKVADVNVKELQDALRANNAYLGDPYWGL